MGIKDTQIIDNTERSLMQNEITLKKLEALQLELDKTRQLLETEQLYNKTIIDQIPGTFYEILPKNRTAG